jgi:hypothetical protein
MALDQVTVDPVAGRDGQLDVHRRTGCFALRLWVPARDPAGSELEAGYHRMAPVSAGSLRRPAEPTGPGSSRPSHRGIAPGGSKPHPRGAELLTG